VAHAHDEAPTAEPAVPARVEARRDTRLWELYEPHRARVSRLLTDPSIPLGGSLCVLGAGLCNDLDLSLLVSRFARLDLVDWDGSAMVDGLQQQRLALATNIFLHGGVDVSGVGGILVPGAGAVCRVAPDMERLPAACNVVVSMCMLTQLFDAATSAIGHTHPRLGDVIRAVRAEHLRLLLDLTCPLGIAILRYRYTVE
jgi:hypothetical protein